MAVQQHEDIFSIVLTNLRVWFNILGLWAKRPSAKRRQTRKTFHYKKHAGTVLSGTFDVFLNVLFECRSQSRCWWFGLASQQLLLRTQSQKKVNHLALGLNEWGIGAQFLIAVASRLAPWPTRFLTSGYWEIIPQGIKLTSHVHLLIRLRRRSVCVCVCVRVWWVGLEGRRHRRWYWLTCSPVKLPEAKIIINRRMPRF
jgi:hypothetical protein